LTSIDKLLPADFDGDGQDDMMIHYFGALGLLLNVQSRSTGDHYLHFLRKYHYWGHNFLYYAPWGHATNSRGEGGCGSEGHGSIGLIPDGGSSGGFGLGN